MRFEQLCPGCKSGDSLVGVFLHRIGPTVQPFVAHGFGLITWWEIIRISASLLVKPRILGSSSLAIVM